MGQSRPLFCFYFRYFLDTISIIKIEKSIDGVLGIRTRGRRMVGADETYLFGLYKHKSFPLGPIQSSSPSTKELYASILLLKDALWYKNWHSDLLLLFRFSTNVLNDLVVLFVAISSLKMSRERSAARLCPVSGQNYFRLFLTFSWHHSFF